MGEDVEKTFPDPEPGKWYCCTMQAYFGGGPPFDCTQNFIGLTSCCKTGAQLQAWLDAGLECFAGAELCILTGFTTQRLKSAVGPFDTQAACLAAC